MNKILKIKYKYIMLFILLISNLSANISYSSLIKDGEMYLNNNKPNKAIISFSKALMLNKNKIEAYNFIALTYFLSSDYDTALELTKKILKIKFNKENELKKSISCLLIGDTYLKQNNYKNAKYFYKKALLYDNDIDVIINTRLAILELNMSNYINALKYFNTISMGGENEH